MLTDHVVNAGKINRRSWPKRVVLSSSRDAEVHLSTRRAGGTRRREDQLGMLGEVQGKVVPDVLVDRPRWQTRRRHT